MTAVGPRDSERDALVKRFFLKNRFSDGLKLSIENVLTLGWLYLLESGRESVSLREHDVKGAIVEASRHLHLEIEPHRINTLIQRLLQAGVMKAVVVGKHQGCRLARLGRHIAKNLLEEARLTRARRLNGCPDALRILHGVSKPRTETTGCAA